MILLDATTDSLEVDLDGAVSTNQLPFTASYADLNQSTFAITSIANNDGTTNSTTAVTLVAAPSASRTRKISFLSIYNADTASATVTVQLNANSTLRTLCKIALAVGSTLQYMDGAGFQVIDSAGRIQTVHDVDSHTLLNASMHTDTVAQTVSRGSLIYGNSTPAWDELGIGANNRLLRSDGTDVSWSQVAISTDVSGLGTGVATFLATPSSANLASAVTDETGSGALVFAASPTFTGTITAAAITATGNLDFAGLDLTASDGTITFTTTKDSAASAGWNFTGPTTPTNGTFIQLSNGATAFLYIGNEKVLTGSGSTTKAGFYATTWPSTASAANAFLADGNVIRLSTSSRRYKDSIVDLEGAGLTEILKLRPVSFVGKHDKAGSRGKWRHFGFIAEEVDAIMPNLVEYEQVDGAWVPARIEYPYLTAPIVKAIQELTTRVVVLEKKTSLL